MQVDYGSFDQDFEDPEGIDAFAQALLNDPSDAISAVSDWAPIREVGFITPCHDDAHQQLRAQRIKSVSGLKRDKDVVREGWAYDLSRWPLLSLLFFLISTEFIIYILVRQCVNLLEYGLHWWGKKGRLRRAMRAAKTYSEWKAAALNMDEYLGFDRWKRSSSYAYYDSPLIRRVRDNLRELREADDVHGVTTVLEICLRSNFAGIESGRLYSETYYGTKDLVEDYLSELEASLTYIRHTEKLTLAEKHIFFRTVSRHFGTTALCLSGGASLGFYHFGVIKALRDARLVPRVISGTSAGSLVAALVCCRTDEELEPLLTPKLANRITAFEDDFATWSKRLWKTGARYDAVSWARKATWFTCGSMTFKEAYERTGRILNVSVVPYSTHSPTKLLNYITAPDCVIYTACIASAAVPGLLQPVVLMNKTKTGKLVPWQFQGRHKDGSLRVDIPLQSLHLLFNCNFSIVSQVNPHISLFFFQPRGAAGRPVSHRKGRGWRGGYLLAAAEQFLKIELAKNFRVIRDLELMPEFGGQNWTSLFLQKFEGSVTIWPRSRLWDWLSLLTDPDEKELARMIDVGQRATWPKIHMIENRMKIESLIDTSRHEIRAQLRPATSENNQSRFDAVESAFESHSDSDSNGGYLSSEVPFQKTRPLRQDAPPKFNHDAIYVQTEADQTNGTETSSRKREIFQKLGLAGEQGRDSRATSGNDSPATTKLGRRFSANSLRLAKRVRGRPERQGYAASSDGFSSG